MTQSELVTQPKVEPVQEVKAISSPTRKALRRFRRHRLAMFGVCGIIILVIAALLGSETAALTQDLKNANKPPSAQFFFGTDRTGRDVFARTLVGGRVSLMVGLVAVVFSTLIGVTLGALAGFYRGWVDMV